MSTPKSAKEDLHRSVEHSIESSYQKIQQLQAYIRGYLAGGGKDFQIDGLDEALDTACAALVDYKIRSAAEKRKSDASEQETARSDPF